MPKDAGVIVKVQINQVRHPDRFIDNVLQHEGGKRSIHIRFTSARNTFLVHHRHRTARGAPILREGFRPAPNGQSISTGTFF